MKTNLNNISQKCSWRNLQQNYVQQLSDLFVENRYFKFQNEIQFFPYYNNWTLKHRDLESFCGCNWPISCFFQVLHRITCMTGLWWCHGTILFLPFSLTHSRWWAPNARCLVTDDANFTAFSDNHRRRWRSVAQTSALLCGNEWTSLQTFALTLWLELI